MDNVALGSALCFLVGLVIAFAGLVLTYLDTRRGRRDAALDNTNVSLSFFALTAVVAVSVMFLGSGAAAIVAIVALFIALLGLVNTIIVSDELERLRYRAIVEAAWHRKNVQDNAKSGPEAPVTPRGVLRP